MSSILIVILAVFAVLVMFALISMILCGGDSHRGLDKAPEKPTDKCGVEVFATIGGVRYVLVHDDGDATCNRCDLCGSLGVCNVKNFEPTTLFGSVRPCYVLKGVWKKV